MQSEPISVVVEIPTGEKYQKANPTNNVEQLQISNWNGDYTDGIHLNGNDFFKISNCVIGRPGKDPASADELISGVNGADIIFYRCRFRDNGKGYLQGSGDNNSNELLAGQRSIFYECIFENNSRRNPFIQVGQGYLIKCLIKNWGRSFHQKSFGARAGKYGQLTIVNSIFEQESFLTCLKRGTTFKDIIDQYPLPLPGVPGFMRGAYADWGGHVITHNCHKNRWWIYLQNRTGKLSKDEATSLKNHLESVVPNF